MMRYVETGRLLPLILALVLPATLAGCKFSVTYPDSFAYDLGNPDERGDDASAPDGTEPDSPVPDSVEDTSPDVTPVTCSNSEQCVALNGDLGPCRQWKCLDGLCQKSSLPDGTYCDDQNACTYGEVCGQGLCSSTDTMVCPDDGDPCTNDYCDTVTGFCMSQPLEGCGNCVSEGETVGSDEECCWPLVSVPTCNDACIESGCDAGCCDTTVLVCANTSDGVCQNYENVCNSSDCSAGTCLLEGQTGVLPTECCDATMTLLTFYGDETEPLGECTPVVGGQVVCTQCGNGICGPGEVYCNCPNDCGTVPTTCTTDNDCGTGRRCLFNLCLGCFIEQCVTPFDEDCDGQTTEQPCQSWTCGFNPLDYPGLPISVVLEQANALEGQAISTIGTSMMGPSTCTSACYAFLGLKDSGPAGEVQTLQLTASSVYNPVECKGPYSGAALTCSPIADLGQTFLVWGRFTSSSGVPQLELEGFCKQQ